jgi:hypothetical protein
MPKSKRLKSKGNDEVYRNREKQSGKFQRLRYVPRWQVPSGGIAKEWA